MESIEKIIAEGIVHSPIEMAGELSPPVISTNSSNSHWHKIALALIVVGICSGLIYYGLNLKEKTASEIDNEDRR